MRRLNDINYDSSGIDLRDGVTIEPVSVPIECDSLMEEIMLLDVDELSDLLTRSNRRRDRWSDGYERAEDCLP